MKYFFISFIVHLTVLCHAQTELLARLTNEWFVIDSNGKRGEIYNNDNPRRATCGVGRAPMPPPETFSINGKMGMVLADSHDTIPALYDEISHLTMGSPAVLKVKTGNKFGAVDAKNNMIVPAEYERLMAWGMYKTDTGTEPALLAQKDGKKGVITCLNKTLIPFIYDKIEDVMCYSKYSRGRHIFLISCVKDSSVDYYDHNYLPAVAPEYIIKRWAPGGLIMATDRTGHYGILSDSGEIKVPFIYKTIELYANTGFLLTTDDGKHGAMNLQCQITTPVE